MELRQMSSNPLQMSANDPISGYERRALCIAELKAKAASSPDEVASP